MKSIPNFIKNYTQIIIGAILFAMGVSMFQSPNGIAPGGVSGIAIIITHFFDLIPTGTWVFLLNIPIMIMGIWKLGFKFIVPTVVTIAISSLTMNLIEAFVPPVTNDLLLASVAGGVLVAAGIGFVFRGGATTGGSDIIVKLLRLKFPHISTGAAFLIIDGAICVCAGLVYGDIEKAIYAGISLFIQMNVLNMVLYGSDEARMVYIISEKDSEIAERLLIDLDVGATYLRGNGAYTGKDKKVLMCVMKMRTLPQAREIVKKLDSNAFMIVTKATSVFGEGFKSHTEEDL